MSTHTRSMIGAQLVGHVESLLAYDRIHESGREAADRLVKAWRAELDRDLGKTPQDNISDAEADRIESEIREIMSGNVS